MDYISVKEAAEQWQVSQRWVQKLCKENRIDGVLRFGHSYMIPKDLKGLSILDTASTNLRKRNKFISVDFAALFYGR